jgi:hypothetical protein
VSRTANRSPDRPSIRPSGLSSPRG